MDGLKVGVALGGGASRGWSHIGVIKQLHALGIKPDIVCGTSIGALVGAAYVAGNMEKLEKWVCDLSKLETARYFSINQSFKGFINKDRLEQFLHEFVVNKSLNIEELELPYASVATDLTSGREVWNTSGNVMDAVWSSISLPGLFPAIKLNDRWLLDGGLVNPVPVSLCRALGADIVIAVNLNSDIVGKHIQKNGKENESVSEQTGFASKFSTMISDYTGDLFGNGKRKDDSPDLLTAIAASINITQDRITRSRMAGDPPEVILSPRLAHIGLLEFYRANEAIQEGINCVERHKRDLEYFLQRSL